MNDIFLGKKIEREEPNKAVHKEQLTFKEIKSSKSTKDSLIINEQHIYKKGKDKKNYNITSIKKYKEKKLREFSERYNNKEFNLKSFIQSYDINNEAHKIYINEIISVNEEDNTKIKAPGITVKKEEIKKEEDILTKNEEDISLKNKEFISHYSKYQFVLNLETRKEIQKKIILNEELMKINMIKYNIIPDNINSLREVITNLTKDIINFQYYDKSNKNIEKDIINMFINNKVYFNCIFEYLIPTKYSENLEYKYNKLLFDIAHFFLPFKDILDTKNLEDYEQEELLNNISLFAHLTPFIEKIDLINDENDLIDRFDFLFNILEIFQQSKEDKRNYSLLDEIITICLPFNLNKAKNVLSKIKKYYSKYPGIKINDLNIKDFNIDDFNEDSKITLISNEGNSNNKLRKITVNANEINWYLKSDLMNIYEGDNFMLCFVYKSCLDKNYLKLNKEIDENFSALFKKMIKSEIVRQAMNNDLEAEKFDYIFNNDDIIEECEESIYYVPFPVKGFYGYTDKNSFRTYIYSNFCVNSIKNTFTEFDNLLKTKSHEYKHISRIYYHIFEPSISLSTPPTNKDHRELIINKIDDINNKIKSIKTAYDLRYIPFINKFDNAGDVDYGDIFEYSLTGSKSSNFFLANSYFFLKDSSWNLNHKNFFNEYTDSIVKKNILIQKNKKNYPFVTSLLTNFKFDSNKIFVNELSTKDSSKESIDSSASDFYVNEHSYKENNSHYSFDK